ncbi:hypothetical protein KKC32_05275 [Patescibacteria group bacterium]|nr:hypothetical protein [Patescibacteria group bacterium]
METKSSLPKMKGKTDPEVIFRSEDQPVVEKRKETSTIREFLESAEVVADEAKIKALADRLNSDIVFLQEFTKDQRVKAAIDIVGGPVDGRKDEKRIDFINEIFDKYLNHTKPGDSKIKASTSRFGRSLDPSVSFLDKSRRLRFAIIELDKLQDPAFEKEGNRDSDIIALERALMDDYHMTTENRLWISLMKDLADVSREMEEADERKKKKVFSIG